MNVCYCNVLKVGDDGGDGLPADMICVANDDRKAGDAVVCGYDRNKCIN